MFKRHFYLFVFIFPLIVGAQTKLISHKSHSGTKEEFIQALSEGLFDVDNSNFGMAPEPLIKTSQLDSVVFISDSVSVMYTSEYCTRQSRIQYPNYKGSKWGAGADTVINHPLFKLQHNLDSIKRALRSEYYFRNDIDSVRFIGFDNQQVLKGRKQQRQEYIPGIEPVNTRGSDWFWMVMLVFLLSVLAGLVSWKFIKA
jgi:hypothetical protein